MAPEAIAADTYATPADLAARYKVSRRTVNYWASSGIITPAFRRGNVVRFIAEEVDRQLESQPEAAASTRGGD